MSARIDRVGHRFGRLLVTGPAPSAGTRARWACRCDCGKAVDVLAWSLACGMTRSCGCLHLQIVRQKGRNARHGLTRSPVHNAWVEMRKRCADLEHPNYGARGIKVCDRWAAFENFLADMGHPPAGCELDRIDVNGDYEPGNCRWIDLVGQARNKRSNRLIEFGGEWITVAEYAQRLGVGYSAAYYRARLSAAGDRTKLARDVDQLGVMDDD
jgi:hypothetical protein